MPAPGTLMANGGGRYGIP